MKYAAKTEVSVEKSRGEIEKTLTRYGATKFAYFMEKDKACIAFEVEERRIRFILPLPSRGEDSIRLDRWGYVASDKTIEGRWQQASRQRWRALCLAIKAKLEWVETGIVTIEEEFLPYIVTQNGKTVAELLMPQLDKIYESGKMPKLLPESFS
jgi:hypothetical protein